jgi:hypothetical protein
MFQPKQEAFSKTFKDLSNDRVISYWNCALHRGISLNQGHLYLTDQNLCFSAKFLGKKTIVSFFKRFNSIQEIIPLVSIKNLEKVLG